MGRRLGAANGPAAREVGPQTPKMPVGAVEEACAVGGGHGGADDRPILLLTMGDPAGIGPEISLQAAASAAVRAVARPVVVGDAGVLERAGAALGAGGRGARIGLDLLERPAAARLKPGRVDVVDLQI